MGVLDDRPLLLRRQLAPGLEMLADLGRPGPPATLAIYNQLVADTTLIWSDRPETLEERTAWFSARRARGFPVLVAVDRGTGEVVGIGTYGDFRDSQSKPGYRFTVEHSIHVRRDRTGAGVGALLLDALFERARTAGVHAMIAGADAANAGAIRFHQRHGFVEVARFREVGRKFGRWLDLVFLQRIIGDPGEER
jgi:L-amino acid N-acyltransferase YncA